ncbi:hypothetical protein H5187_21430 [Pseudoalteromonas sp. SG44-1]|uniref:hypothetical protein n=1 Tax=Pseudoalteromonas sp. SG44-1 TaxID=2760964 RepID=UPI001603B439|nr:hypothetical protein [Pseudoalteromonas sp. SG44-1]MBB1419806.1 hypothetical protein [Pseudoalteromonas sp. SG44-1]
MKEKKQRNFTYWVIFSFLLIVISFVVHFYLRFGWSYESNLDTWVKTASYFNNILSPVLVTVTIILLFMTWKDNKSELKQIREQNEVFNRQNENHQKNQDNQSLYLAILPQITKSIEDVSKDSHCALVCNIYKLYVTDHEPLNIKIVDEKSASHDLKDYLECLAISVVTDEHGSYRLSKTLTVPKLPKIRAEDNIFQFIVEFALKVKRNEKGRKYKKLPKRPADLNKHLRVSLLFQLKSNKHIEKLVSSHISNSPVNFFEYCQLRFGDWEEELRNANSISEQLSPFRAVMENIEYIASLMNMLPDDTREKIILSKHIYKSLGRYEIYVFLEHTFQFAYDNNSPFRNYFEISFTEISKVLFLNESAELYQYRLQTNWNPKLTDKLIELSTKS